MMGTLVVLSLLAADVATPELQAQRELPRFHGELSAAGGFGLSQPAFGAGPGVYVEAGVTVDDAHTVSLRGSLVTVVSLGVLQAGAMFSEFIGDHFTVGGGISWTFISGISFEYATGTAIHIPLRVQWLANERPANERARRGFTIGLEFAPGVAYALNNPPTLMPQVIQESPAAEDTCRVGQRAPHHRLRSVVISPAESAIRPAE
ncbi:MAG: hypothetical protein QM817_24185 [Archangium sp.]